MTIFLDALILTVININIVIYRHNIAYRIFYSISVSQHKYYLIMAKNSGRNMS
jgi:hypothetical protein